MDIEKIHSPRWANKERTLINFIVKSSRLKVEGPYTASPVAGSEQCREVYRRCLDGEFGEIAEFEEVEEYGDVQAAEAVPASPPPPEMIEFMKFLGHANSENSKGTVRGVILVWAAFVEQLLGDILQEFLIDHGSTRKLIFEDSNGPMSTFSGRSKCCFSLGLISRSELTACNHIRNIRNIAAHEWELGLENERILKKFGGSIRALYDADHAEHFHWVDNDLEYMIRSFYSGSAARLAVQLANRRLQARAEQRAQKSD